MPLYVYKCTKCIHSDEYLMKSADSDIALECEMCGQDMHRVFGQINNQVVKWTRRYVDENGRDTVVSSSPPGGSYRTNYRKKKNHGKGEKFVYDIVTDKMVQQNDRRK